MMKKSHTKFPFKIIISYIAISFLAASVVYILFMEFRNLTKTNEQENQMRFIEAGTLINHVYEVDSYSRIALLTFSDSDYDLYKSKADSLFNQIEELKQQTQNEQQQTQLDSIKILIKGKDNTIEQLRFLKTTYSKDTSLDDILEEFKKLENSMGKITLDNFVNDPSRLSAQERASYMAYINFLNATTDADEQISTDIVQSTLEATRYIVSETKRVNSRTRKQLEEKENELINTELNLSSQLRKLIIAFDSEATRLQLENEEKKEASYKRTLRTLSVSGFIGLTLIIFFIYLTVTDFFKAERFKKSLQIAKSYSDSLVKSREQLLNTVSHDLKTPLHSLLGFSQLLEKSKLDKQQSYYVTQLSTSANYANKLVEDLLDYSRLDAGSVTLNEARFCLSDLVENIANSNYAIYANKDIELKVEINPEITDVWFLSDPIRLQQVLNNLISNAFKFTERGEVRIEVSPVKEEGNLHWIQIAIVDTGIGIPEDKLDSIYDEFAQAGTTTHSQFSGSGLGLTITKKLISLLNGSLELESTLGKGTSFICKIPLKLSPQQKQGNKDTIQNLRVPKNALVFDDDPTMLALLKELLASVDVQVKSYTNYKDVETQDLEYDFVLTDIQMPEVNGFEILESLQDKRELNYKEQPIIAMTGKTDLATKSYTELGFADVLTKPFSLNLLIDTLQNNFPQWKVKHATTTLKTNNTEENSELYSLSQLEAFLDSKEAIEEILEVFKTETRNNMNSLKIAIDNLDHDTIQHVAHKMKTMAKQIEVKSVLPILYELDSPIANEIPNNELLEMFKELEVQYSLLFQAMQKD